MDSSIDGILNVTDPQAYYCQVWSYLAGHTQLLIRAYKDDFMTGDTFYLLFTGVLYFDGPMAWQGTDFHIGEPEECFELLRKRQEFSDIPDDYLLDRIRLFKVETPDGDVRILASNVSKGRDVPPDFSWLTEPR